MHLLTTVVGADPDQPLLTVGSDFRVFERGVECAIIPGNPPSVWREPC